MIPTMKKRDEQITFRVSGPLRAALVAEARSEEQELSGLIRKVLINHAANRIAERAGADAEGAH
jgi:predicted HicB family RNase H-like nuclease